MYLYLFDLQYSVKRLFVDENENHYIRTIFDLIKPWPNYLVVDQTIRGLLHVMRIA